MKAPVSGVYAVKVIVYSLFGLGIFLYFAQFRSRTPQQSKTVPPEEIREVGYFKDEFNNRVFTFAIAETATDSEIRSHAERLMNTPGQITDAYYFIVGGRIPGDSVTLAADYAAVSAVLYESKDVDAWIYSYRIFPNVNTKPKFVDCRSASGPCRAR